jgi:hypothetical protein
LSRLPTLYVWQGMQRDYKALQINQQTAPGAPKVPATFPAGTELSASVWEGSDQAVIFEPVVAWNNGGTGFATGQFQVSFPAADNLGLNQDGEYHFLLSVTDANNITRPAFEALLKVIPTPGSFVPSPPDLVTYDYCLGLLSAGITLTDAQIDALPALITAASNLFREKCNDRYFDLRTLTEEHEVSLDGYVRLWQEPVQIVTRVQGQPNLALTVNNNSSSVQTAQAYFAFTGFDGGVGMNAKTATGVTLNWVSNGTPNNQTILFAAAPTIGQLAAAINAVGSGWQAQVASAFGPWVCTELVGGYIAQGCTPVNSQPGFARFHVLTDLDGCRLIPRTPILFVGTHRGGNATAEMWGPGGEELWGRDGDYQTGSVKVTYQAGFNVIPPTVQEKTAELVKYMLELLKQELLLASEKAGDYEYSLSNEQVRAIPKPIWEAMGYWKLHYA